MPSCQSRSRRPRICDWSTNGPSSVDPPVECPSSISAAPSTNRSSSLPATRIRNRLRLRERSRASMAIRHMVQGVGVGGHPPPYEPPRVESVGRRLTGVGGLGPGARGSTPSLQCVNFRCRQGEVAARRADEMPLRAVRSACSVPSGETFVTPSEDHPGCSGGGVVSDPPPQRHAWGVNTVTVERNHPCAPPRPSRG